VSLDGKRILLDCRWLGLGGAGRATELLLRGLAEVRPAGEWTLWGPEPVGSFAWAGAAHEPSSASPKAWGGQRTVRLPEHDVAVYLHQIRPLRRGRSVTLIHDTIPLRHGSNRLAKRLYLRAVARLSTRIVTVSEHSRRSIEGDLAVPPEKISVVTYPVDAEQAARVRRLRDELPARDAALYVGSFSPHKNLGRLIHAFAETRFRAEGGTLRLVGGDANELPTALAGVEVEGPCSQERLEELYATSRLLVQPSLEEGFGLPAWEAMCCGLPVCASDSGSLPEVTKGLVRTFSPTSVPELTATIDAVADEGADVSAEVAAGAPSLEGFARRFVDEAAVAAG
jgi:glycosyltransferase involved in cell wall biosynthesis